MKPDRVATEHDRLTTAIADLSAKAERVTELYRAAYLVGRGDGGRVAHAMGQLADAILALRVELNSKS